MDIISWQITSIMWPLICIWWYRRIIFYFTISRYHQILLYHITLPYFTRISMPHITRHHPVSLCPMPRGPRCPVAASGHGYVAGPLPRLELHAAEGAAAGAGLGDAHGWGDRRDRRWGMFVGADDGEAQKNKGSVKIEALKILKLWKNYGKNYGKLGMFAKIGGNWGKRSATFPGKWDG